MEDTDRLITSDLASVYNMDNNADYENDSLLQSLPCKSEYVQPCELAKTMKYSDAQLSCFHLNCRGLVSNWSSFNDLLNNIDNHFHFIGVSECFKIHNDPKIKIPGYHEVLCKNRNDSSRGGVALFVSERYDFKSRDDLSVFIPHVFESLFVEIILPGRKNELIGVIYRPNTQPMADLDIFHGTMNEILSMVNSEKKLCTLMGDFNIDLLQYNTNHKTNSFLDDMFSFGFAPVILKPTRITDTTATLLDHIYTNNISELKDSAIIITDVADHLATAVFFKRQYKSSESKTIKSRDFSENSIIKFKNYLLQADFSDVYKCQCPEESYTTFLNIYQTGFEDSFPYREIKIKQKKQTEPWYTDELKSSWKIKNKLYSNNLFLK